MANVLHRTATPTDYRRSQDTAQFNPAQWYINPDVSAVSNVPPRYWQRPLTDPVQPMTQAERAAVDAAAAAARRQAQVDAEKLRLRGSASEFIVRAIVRWATLELNTVRAALNPPLPPLTRAQVFQSIWAHVDADDGGDN